MEISLVKGWKWRCSSMNDVRTISATEERVVWGESDVVLFENVSNTLLWRTGLRTSGSGFPRERIVSHQKPRVENKCTVSGGKRPATHRPHHTRAVCPEPPRVVVYIIAPYDAIAARKGAVVPTAYLQRRSCYAVDLGALDLAVGGFHSAAPLSPFGRGFNTGGCQ